VESLKGAIEKRIVAMEEGVTGLSIEVKDPPAGELNGANTRLERKFDAVRT
jgi:hypothetical protein